MLEDVCQAAEDTVDRLVGSDGDQARRVIEEFPRVFSSCDQLEFKAVSQALAYLILHLPDRYCRQFQVLERLLTSGYLPMGKSDGFAVIDIGAGPGPGIFATRSFYAALAHYAAANHPSWRVATLGFSDVVERSRGMHRVMHYFAESLVPAELGQLHRDDAESQPNPCIAELSSSPPPFRARFDDFTALDVGAARRRAQQQSTEEMYEDDALVWRWEEAAQPGAYALAIMMNFLTPGSEAMLRFSEAVDRLMTGALVPGGTILVLGGYGPDYQEQVYRELDQRAAAAHLTIVEGFGELLKAGHRADERAAVRDLTRHLWGRLALLAGDVSHVEDELRNCRGAKIFDQTKRFGFPRFQARAYRRGL
jgi:hypothetical protein